MSDIEIDELQKVVNLFNSVDQYPPTRPYGVEMTPAEVTVIKKGGKVFKYSKYELTGYRPGFKFMNIESIDSSV